MYMYRKPKKIHIYKVCICIYKVHISCIQILYMCILKPEKGKKTEGKNRKQKNRKKKPDDTLHVRHVPAPRGRIGVRLIAN